MPLWSGLRSRKESEVFGWSQSRIFHPTFYPTLTTEVQLNHFLHRTPKLGIPTRAY